MSKNKSYQLTRNGEVLGEFPNVDELWQHARSLRIVFDISKEMIQTECNRSGSFSFSHNADRYAVKYA